MNIFAVQKVATMSIKSPTKRVCHLAAIHKSNDPRIFEKECRSLAQNGFAVTYIAFGDAEQEATIDNVRCISLHCPVRNRIEVIRKRNKLLLQKAMEIDADLYHIHEPELLGIGLKLKRRGKKVIFDSHEFYGWQLRDSIHRIKVIPTPKFMMKVYAALYMHYEKYVCKRLDAVIQVCTVNGEDYFSNRCRRSIFIANAPIVQPMHNTYTSSGTFAASTIGSLSEARGITVLVKAAHRAGIKLILAGSYTPASYGDYIKTIPEYSVVDYRGTQYGEDKKRMLDETSVGISTPLHIGQYSVVDTIATKVYDYMERGIPVISTNTKFSKALNDEHHFGICVDPSSVEQIADALQYLKNNPDEAQRMGANGRNAVLNHLGWDNEAAKLVELYNEILNS